MYNSVTVILTDRPCVIDLVGTSVGIPNEEDIIFILQHSAQYQHAFQKTVSNGKCKQIGHLLLEFITIQCNSIEWRLLYSANTTQWG